MGVNRLQIVMNIGTGSDNSYLLIGNKTAVIECVGKENAKLHTENLKNSLGTQTLDYIILNHTSPDNIGSLDMLMELYPDVTIVSSTAGIKNLTEILNKSFKYELAKDEAVLDLGKNITLKFYILPNLPWTDTMAVYYENERILYSGSIFFDDENYSQIYSEYAQNAAERLKNLDIDKILPMYGKPITNPQKVLELYMSDHETVDFIPIIYSSVYGYTAELANAVCSVFIKNGISAKCFNADTETNLHNVLNMCRAFAVGTDTINRNASQSIWNVLTKIDMINKRNTPCLIFGSCGWSGEGAYLAERFLKNIGLKPFGKPFSTHFKPSDEELNQLESYVQKFINERN